MSQPPVSNIDGREKQPTDDGNDRQPKEPKADKVLSRIETLPVELIEKIFLYSLNVNLPRASPHLAAAVSNEQVYRLLILLAFWDNDSDNHWNRGPGVFIKQYKDVGTHTTWKGSEKFNIPRILRPLGHDYVPLSSDQRSAFQSAIIRCRWCTLARVRRQLPDLARLIITRSCFDAGYMFEDESKGRELDELLQSDGTTKMYRALTFRKTADVPERKETEEDEFKNCRVNVKPGESIGFDFYTTLTEGSVGAWYPVLSLTEIPPFFIPGHINTNDGGLVRGPFTDAHLKFLDTILYSAQVLPIAPSTRHLISMAYSRDDVQKGILIAITTINPIALDKLLKIDEALCLGKDDYAYDLLPCHFRTAAKMYLRNHPKGKKKVTLDEQETRDNALLCFCLLLTSSFDSVPYEDPLITRLAKRVGGVFKEWLLDFIFELPEYFECPQGNPVLGDLFRSSRDLNEDCELGMRYREELIPANGIFKIPLDWMVFDISRYIHAEDLWTTLSVMRSIGPLADYTAL